MVANDFVEIFTLPFGFYIQNRFFDLLYYTALLYVPFFYVLLSTMAEVKEKGLSGIEAVEQVLCVIESKFFKMMLVVMVAIVPYTGFGTATPKSINYENYSCNEKYRRSYVAGDPSGLMSGTTFTHSIISHAPPAQVFMNEISTGAVNAVISTIPCEIGYRDVQRAVDGVKVKDPRLSNLIKDFNNQCYVPALSSVLNQDNIDPLSADKSYLKAFSIISEPILTELSRDDIKYNMTSRKSNWEALSNQVNLSSNGRNMACMDAIVDMGKVMVEDDNLKASLYVVGELYDGMSTEYVESVRNGNNPGMKAMVESLEQAELFVINAVFNNTLQETGVYNAGRSEKDGFSITGWVGELLGAIGNAFMWLIGVASAQVALDVIPWMISIFQAGIYAFGIIVIYLNAYSGSSLYKVLVAPLILELLLIGLEFVIWIDNVVLTIFMSKTSSQMWNGQSYYGLSIATICAFLYLYFVKWLYSWLHAAILGSPAAGDISGHSDKAGQAGGFVGASMIGSVLKFGGKKAMGKAKDKWKQTRDAADTFSKR
ncbi:TraG-like protein, N-terminal region [Vibrio xiamenensis]|uniref:TraG-like protein, N-terminal region n=1 Tax=Vibrio xiamenensis TaxID=861298 RepID=A0A1G8CM61_9VIBR|nr:conjugal transfer protein TraG N-terminal domain-containing protein [Vibrio xiamenensis]SDH45920.1 TraG-like protein, N-terminal region [Vibrio xiamenensis]